MEVLHGFRMELLAAEPLVVGGTVTLSETIRTGDDPREAAALAQGRHIAKNIKLAIPESEITYVPTVATHTIESLPITYDKR